MTTSWAKENALYSRPQRTPQRIVVSDVHIIIGKHRGWGASTARGEQCSWPAVNTNLFYLFGFSGGKYVNKCIRGVQLKIKVIADCLKVVCTAGAV